MESSLVDCSLWVGWGAYGDSENLGASSGSGANGLSDFREVT